MTRRELREHVFLLLFRRDFHSPEETEEQVAFYFDGAALSEESEKKSGGRLPTPPEGSDAEEVKGRFYEACSHREEIDAALAGAMSGWRLERIGKVELTILRLAIFEMLFDEKMPEGVAISEAVLLAKKYGAEASSGFINGVLAKLTQEQARPAERP